MPSNKLLVSIAFMSTVSLAPVSAATLAYNFNGYMMPAGLLAETLLDIADGIDRDARGHVPFTAQLLVETDVEPEILQSTSLLQSYLYRGAIVGGSINLGGYRFGQIREAATRESAIGILNFVPPTFPDRLEMYLGDGSRMPPDIFPGDPLFNGFTVPWGDVLDGVRYESLTFEGFNFELLADGAGMLSSPDIPTEGVPIDAATSVFSFDLLLSANPTFSNANLLSRVATFAAFDYHFWISPVPEPSGFVLFLAGLTGVAAGVQRRRQRGQP